MKRAELKGRLHSEGFRPDAYSIDSPLPAHEGLILEKVGAVWKIDHFERGVRDPLGRFATEDEACDRMYELLDEHFRPQQS